MFYQIRHELRVFFFLTGLCLRRLQSDRFALLTNTVGMLLNNILFFVIWILIFSLVKDLRGWQLPDVALMFGLGASAFGMAGVMFGGFRQLASDIETGRFDAHLCRPASTFTLALTSHGTHHAVGDALTGPIFWLLFCDFSLAQVALLFVLMFLGAGIVAAIGMTIYSMAFWLHGTRNHAEIVLFWLISFLTTPLHGMPKWIKAIVLSVVPIGYVSYMPVEIIRDPSWDKILMVLGGLIWAVVLGRFVFYRGLRQYKGVSSLRTGI